MPSFAQMLLYYYTGLLGTLFRLLNCSPVCISCPPPPSVCSTSTCQSKSVLFYAGEVECGWHWQLPLWLLLVLCILLPMVPITIWALRHCIPPSPSEPNSVSPRYERMRMWVHSPKSNGASITRAIKHVACQPFSGSTWPWAAVLVAQRLAMVSFATFENEQIGKANGVVLVAMCGLVLQLHSRPYRVSWVNTLQAVAYTCLVGLAVLNLATQVFDAVGFDPAGTPLLSQQHEADILMFAILFLPPLLCLYGTVFWGKPGDTEARALARTNSRADLEDALLLTYPTPHASHGELLGLLRAKDQEMADLRRTKDQEMADQLRAKDQENSVLKMRIVRLNTSDSAKPDIVDTKAE